MGGLLSHPPPQGQPAPSRRPLGLQRGGPRHLAPAGAGWGPGGGDASPAPSELLSDSEFPGCCQPDSAVLAANRSSGTGGGRAGVRTGGLWGGHPLPRQRDPPPPRPGLGAACQRWAGHPGLLPHGGGGGGEEERASEGEAFKIPLWRDKHRSHFRTGISALGLASLPHSRDGH